MKKKLKNLLPQAVVDFIKTQKSMSEWRKRNFSDNSPQIVKQNVFLKYGIKDAAWVETGTYLGTTTSFLSGLFPHVYSLEPEPKLYAAACERFKDKNVSLFNDVSENIFPSLLPKLSGI
ncbi:MAG: Uncharacterised protein [Alphaproteobacteria bacterium]|nr:MAG: Uncharacterised protein [Alphaproteobacteria bacterium]